MISNPYFSVIIPVYNKEPHINRAINSVLRQSFQNFEIVIINDASTDNSLHEIQKFCDSRISLYHRKQPGPGGYAARNWGIKKAKGDWIAFLDADDEWYLNHLERMYELARQFPEINLLGCGWRTQNNEIKKENSFYKKHKKVGRNFEIDFDTYLKNCNKIRIPVFTSVICIKTNSFITQNIFPIDNEIKQGGDLYAWLKLICYYKKMAWSNHIGAIYFMDSVNKVTKTEKIAIKLYSKEYYNELSKNLNLKEKNLLKKYMNSRLFQSWLYAIPYNKTKLNIRKHIYWKGIFFNGLITFLITSIPVFVIRLKYYKYLNK